MFRIESIGRARRTIVSEETGRIIPYCYRRSLHFNFGRGEIPSRAQRLESYAFVRAIAERLVLGVATAAQAKNGAPREVEFIPIHVLYREIALQPDRSIIHNRDFCWHQSDANKYN